MASLLPWCISRQSQTQFTVLIRTARNSVTRADWRCDVFPPAAAGGGSLEGGRGACMHAINHKNGPPSFSRSHPALTRHTNLSQSPCFVRDNTDTYLPLVTEPSDSSPRIDNEARAGNARFLKTFTVAGYDCDVAWQVDGQQLGRDGQHWKVLERCTGGESYYRPALAAPWPRYQFGMGENKTWGPRKIRVPSITFYVRSHYSKSSQLTSTQRPATDLLSLLLHPVESDARPLQVSLG